MKRHWYLFIPAITNKFRIREITMHDNVTTFVPQVRFCGFWVNIRDVAYGIKGYANFNSLEGGEEYLCNITDEHRAGTSRFITTREGHATEVVAFGSALLSRSVP